MSKTGFRVSVVCDSIALGVRLTTFAVRMPRTVLAEANTHRALCLAGDSVLEFDLPAGSKGGKNRRIHRMTIADFVDKWHNGARRIGARPKLDYDLSWVEEDKFYSAGEATARMGLANNSTINVAARRGEIRAQKDGKTWMVRGSDLINWRKSVPEHTRFDMRSRLAGMQIRQLNEDTGDIQTSTVKDAFFSGEKKVYEVVAGGYRVAGSADHRVFTTDGWKTIGELYRGNMIVTARCGTPEDERADPLRLRKIDGRWRSTWQNQMRKAMLAEDRMCRRCRSCVGEDIHHIVPVHVDLSRAFDPANVTLLCEDCHLGQHIKQGWQGGRRLYGVGVVVEDIRERGVEPTYDLEIAGQYPNFLANGVVVHNSRNAASSRAIPVMHFIGQVERDPYIPGDLPDGEWMGNSPGMEALRPLSADEKYHARNHWRACAEQSTGHVNRMAAIGIAKQDANRLLEPFQWVRWLCTATDWDNFFALRTDRRAYPPFRFLARCMYVAYHRSRPEQAKLHLPFIQAADWDAVNDELNYGIAVEPPDWFPGWWYGRDVSPKMAFNLMAWSAARCARVSVKNFRTDATDRAKDFETFQNLTTDYPRHSCYDGDTEFLTPNGWQKASDIDPQEPIASVDTESFRSKFEVPSRWVVSEYTGPMYKLNGQQLDLFVTPNHRMVVKSRIKGGWTPWRFETAESVAGNARRYRVTTTLADAERQSFSNQFGVDRVVFARLVGFFLGDGYAREGNNLDFHLRVPRKIEYLKSLGVPVRDMASDVYKVTLPGIGRWFAANCYDANKEKIPPAGFLTCTEDEIAGLLDGLKNSDGSIRRRTWVYDTTSRPLADFIQAASSLNGLVAQQSRPTSHGVIRTNFSDRSEPRADIGQEGRARSYTDGFESYSGTVYCPTVSTGAVLIRRNGKAVVCGNSPLEHQAFYSSVGYLGHGSNFRKPWIQFRKLVPLETVEEFRPTADEVASWNVPDDVFGGVPGVDW